MTAALQIDKIATDGGTQSRASINADVVLEYAAIIRDGADFPPVTVFYDGKHYWLADGFHRLEAYRLAGATDLPVSIHQGMRRDAILFSVGANADHGLRRTGDDKRRAVMTLLGDKEWSGWSNREIARRAGVGEKFVRSLRPERSEDDAAERTYVTKHGTASKMDTAKIGKAKAAPDAQTEFDRQRAAVVNSLPNDIRAREAAKMERRAIDRSEGEPSAEDAEELRNIIASQQEEISGLRRTVAKFDDMAVEFERGGFENVIAGLNQRIENLQRQVERESKEKLKNLRSADYWKKKAIEAGANADIAVNMETGEMTRG